MSNQREAGSFIARPTEGGPRGCNPFSRFFKRQYVVTQVQPDGFEHEVGVFQARTITGALREARKEKRNLK